MLPLVSTLKAMDDKCGATVRVAAAEVRRILMEKLSAEICSARCTHCGALKTFAGFSTIEAFICYECGEGVTVERLVQ